MSTKTALNKKTYESLVKEFSAKVDSLSTADNGLNTETAKKEFRKTLLKSFVLVDSHGNVVKESESMFTDPGYNPEPGTC